MPEGREQARRPAADHHHWVPHGLRGRRLGWRGAARVWFAGILGPGMHRRGVVI